MKCVATISEVEKASNTEVSSLIPLPHFWDVPQLVVASLNGGGYV
jgi:hypothetical protein